MSSELITSLVIIGIIIALVKDLLPPVVIFFSGLLILNLAGVIDGSVLLSGFSNETIIIIGSMFVISYSLQKTLNINGLVSKAIGKSKSPTKILLRLMTPVALSSSLVNNTPIVATLVQPVIQWANKKGISPNYILVPLSYAAIIGGTLTLIGTSTSLVASGVMESLGYGKFSFFSLTPISLPIAIILIIIVSMIAFKILKPREYTNINKDNVSRQFILEAKPTNTTIGKTISDAKLRNLKNVFLLSIIRSNGDSVTPVNPDTKILKGDIFLFSGEIESLMKLEKSSIIKIEGHKHSRSIPDSSTYYEVVVGADSYLSSSTLKKINFRSMYQSAVLAIYRAGEKIQTNIGDTTLKPGDSLLVISGHDFENIWADRSDFLYIRELGKNLKTSKKNSYSVLLIIGLVLLMLALGSTIATATLTGAILCILLRLINYEQLKRALHIDVLILIGASLSLAKAVEVSGLATYIGQKILEAGFLTSALSLLILFIILTTLLTEVITNVSAVSLMLPIATATAVQVGIDPIGIAIAVTLAASLSFISPFGYQTNTLVYSAGGYKFTDFVRIGIFITIASVTLNILLSWQIFY